MVHDVSAWLAAAVADAKARNLPGLEPLLEGLSKSLQALRDADTEFGHPAIPFDSDPEAAPQPPIPDPRSPASGNDPPA